MRDKLEYNMYIRMQHEVHILFEILRTRIIAFIGWSF